MHRISGKQAMNFFHMHTNMPRTPGLRFGQEFMNTFYPDVVDPELFYETDKGVCWKIICDRYVDWEGVDTDV